MSIIPVLGMPEIGVDADLARMIRVALGEAGVAFQSGDVLVVTQKVVSKREGRRVALSTVTPSARAHELSAITRKDARLVELVLRESSEVLRAVPDVLIARHRSGHVMANAGVDRSNIGPDHADDALLLPIECRSLPVRPTVHSAVLPASTPDKATDFFGLKGERVVSVIGVLPLAGVVFAIFAGDNGLAKN